MSSIRQDLAYGLRALRQSPGFAAAAILSLALGIGANTALFALWHGVVRSPLPAVDKPHELIMLSDPSASGLWIGWWGGPTDPPRPWLTYTEFEAFRDHARSFSGLMASQSSLATFPARFDAQAPEPIEGRLVSGEFFRVLGVTPLMGRVFTRAEDDAPAPVAVISYNYWQRRFGGRLEVLGTAFRIRNALVTIVGVTPRGFIGETAGQQPDVWLPLRLQPDVLPERNWLQDTPPEKVMWLHVFGRLKPGITLTQAEAEARGIFLAGLESFYASIASPERRRERLDQQLRAHSAERGASPSRSEFSQSLAALLVAVGVLLLIACGNLANLLLARGAGRAHEMALRVSLGATRDRLIRQLVTESLALAAAGSVAAIGVASILHRELVRMMVESDSRFALDFTLSPTVAIFLIVVTFASVLLFGLFPAWHATKTAPAQALRIEGRTAMSGSRQMRPGRLLVSAQLALSLPLLVAAGLLVRTVNTLQNLELGFAAERLLLLRVDLRDASNDVNRRNGLVGELREQFQRIPGVATVSYSNLGVFGGGRSFTGIEVEGYTPKGDRDRGSAVDAIGPGYFSTLGVPIREGREIAERDYLDAQEVCVINEAFAERFFEGRNPVGLRVTSLEDDGPSTSCQIVGVAGNARTQNLRDEIEPAFFVTARPPSFSADDPIFLLRTNVSDPSSVLGAVRTAVQRVDASVPILSAETLNEQMAPMLAQDRATALLAAVFGGVALALAAIGLYGVLSYGIARRRGEIAVRVALGAQPARVVAMIFRETSTLVALGLATGGALAYTASRLIESRLYGVEPQDPLTIALAIGLLLMVAFAATYLPAARASRVDPAEALR